MFSETDVKIFEYWDGEKRVATDPVEISCRLEQEDLDFGRDYVAVMELHDKPALDRIVHAGRKMFNLVEPHYVEDKFVGLTDGHVLILMTEFILWMNNIKKNIVDSQTVTTPTEDVPSN